MNIYEDCPVIQNEKYLLRLVTDDDLSDLLKVYSDVNAVQFFNGDNCHGDDFHYTTVERMRQALDFWNKRIKTDGSFVLRLWINKQIWQSGQ